MGVEALEAGDPRRVGRYRVVARLGAGGMGRVFLARSPGGRPVAVKVVREELAQDPAFRTRFAREVAAARRVNGFFTAGVVDADPEGSPPWLATAYVAGLSLVEAVAGFERWPERAVRMLGAGLVEALEAIHGAGVVHRDLKPSNVLLAPDGPRVIDFGISLAGGGTALTRTGAVVGTPGFMPPEQLTRGDTGPAGDVFALGAVLVYAGTGAGPFGDDAAHAVNYRAVYEPPRLGDLPPALRELAGQCLEKDPGQRPSLDALLARLGGDEADAAAALDWLPVTVARAVRERTENALPGTPPPATEPDAAPPPPSAAPPQPPTETAVTPPPVPAPASVPGADTNADTNADTVTKRSRRTVLGIAAGVVALTGAGVLTRILTGDDEGDGGSSAGGTGGAAPPEEGNDQVRTVRIMVQAPLTGMSADLGQDMLDAAKLAGTEANASGGYPGLRFEVAGADDMGDASMAASAARLAIDDEAVLAVVGPAFSGTTMEAAPLYGRAGLAAVSPSATEPSLTEEDFGTFLRAAPDDRQTGEAIGDLLVESGAARVTVIDDWTTYGSTLADAAQERLEAAGVTVERLTVPDRTTDHVNAARRVADSDADALAYLGYYSGEGLATFATRLAQEGFTGTRVSGDAAMDEAFTAAEGEAAEGWYTVGGGHDLSAGAAGRDFADRYEQAYGRPPGRYAARTYDVTTMIVETVAGLGAEADREAVQQELADIRHDGISGEIRFDGSGGYRGTGPQLHQVREGAFVPLGPVDDFRG